MYTIYNTTNKVIDKIFLIIGIIILLYGLYCSYDNYLIYTQALDKSVTKYRPDLLKGEEPEDLPFTEGYVAWLTIDDTAIDYPVMQGKDNAEFLNKDPYGNFSLSGSIFLDSRNKKDFSDDYSLIYGHHIKGDVMFGTLDAFMKKDYFDEHRKGTLIVGNKEYDITLFSATESDVYASSVFDPTETEGPMEYLRKEADIFYEPDEGRIIGLSTCKTPDSIYRTCVFGIIKERKTAEITMSKEETRS